MNATRFCRTAFIFLIIVCAALFSSAALAERIYTTGAGDGILDQTYDHGVGGITAVTGSQVLDCLYQVHMPIDNPNYLNVNRKAVLLFPMASLASMPAESFVASLHFYSFGMNNVTLYGIISDDGIVEDSDWYGTNVPIGALTNSEGWESVDVTQSIWWQLDVGAQWADLRFAYGAGSLAASEDAEGRGAYLEINPVPEPSGLLALLAGVSGLGAMIIRRRK